MDLPYEIVKRIIPIRRLHAINVLMRDISLEDWIKWFVTTYKITHKDIDDYLDKSMDEKLGYRIDLREYDVDDKGNVKSPKIILKGFYSGKMTLKKSDGNILILRQEHEKLTTIKEFKEIGKRRILTTHKKLDIISYQNVEQIFDAVKSIASKIVRQQKIKLNDYDDSILTNSATYAGRSMVFYSNKTMANILSDKLSAYNCDKTTELIYQSSKVINKL